MYSILQSNFNSRIQCRQQILSIHLQELYAWSNSSGLSSDMPILTLALFGRRKESLTRVTVMLSVQASGLLSQNLSLLLNPLLSDFTSSLCLLLEKSELRVGGAAALHRCTAMQWLLQLRQAGSCTLRATQQGHQETKILQKHRCHFSHYFFSLPYAKGLYLKPASSRFSAETAHRLRSAAVPGGKQTCWLERLTLLILSFCICWENILNRNISTSQLLGRSWWDIPIPFPPCTHPSAHLASC